MRDAGASGFSEFCVHVYCRFFPWRDRHASIKRSSSSISCSPAYVFVRASFALLLSSLGLNYNSVVNALSELGCGKLPGFANGPNDVL